MGRRTNRVEVTTYLTPDQAKKVDELRVKLGGISRSAAIRALAVAQLKYLVWLERQRLRGRKPHPRARPVTARRPVEVGRYLIDVRAEEIYEAAIAAVRQNPNEIDRILAARTMKLLDLAPVEFNPTRNAEVQPFVQRAKRALEGETRSDAGVGDLGQKESEPKPVDTADWTTEPLRTGDAPR